MRSMEALFLSPKNSTEGALAVLEAAKCSVWVNPCGYSCPLVDDILQKRSMKVFHLPEVDELLNAETTESYPYTTTFDEASQTPFCLLHTSGSTGLPKPIAWSHGLIGTMDAVRLLPHVEGDDGLSPWTDNWIDGDRIYSSFPMSHVFLPRYITKSPLLTEITFTGRRYHHEHSPAVSLRSTLYHGP